MEINLITNNLRSHRKISEGTNRISYEWDIIVPDSKPDIHKILNAEAVCTVSDKEIMQDRAMIGGVISMNVMYVPANDTGILKSIDNSQNFNAVLELEGLRNNMYLNCRAKAVKCDASAINSRKIKIRCEIEVCGSASVEEDIMYINGIEGNDIEYLVKDISTSCAVLESENRIEIREDVSLPAGMPSAEELIKISMKVNDRDIRAMNGKLLVKGELTATVIYNSVNAGDGLQFAEYTIPFTEIFEDSAVKENSRYDGEFYLENVSANLLSDAEGEKRIISISADIVTEGTGYEDVVISAVVDAYGMECDVDIEKSDSVLTETVNCCETRNMIKEIVDFGKIDEINKVINIIAKEYIKCVTTRKNAVTVDGGIETDLLYNSLESDLPVSYITKEIPFSITVDCAGVDRDSVCEVKTEIVSMAYNIINSSQLELRIAMDIKIRVNRKIKDNILKNITVSAENTRKNNNGIFVYFCDEDEKIWDIAKKYRTTVSEITDANELDDSGEVTRGTKLLIP